MGITIVDPISLPFIENVSNAYVAFGTTKAYVYCTFDASNVRQYNVTVDYGVYYNKDSYDTGLFPMGSYGLELVGNDATVSNIYNFMTQGVSTVSLNTIK